MDKLQLNLTLNEVNLILQSLGELPFKDVFGLINKIQEEANQQLGNKQNPIIPAVENGQEVDQQA